MKIKPILIISIISLILFSLFSMLGQAQSHPTLKEQVTTHPLNLASSTDKAILTPSNVVTEAKLILPSAYWLPRQPLLAVASIRVDGIPLTGTEDVVLTLVNPMGSEKIVSLVDDGSMQDFAANDGLYTAFINHNFSQVLTATLLLNGVMIDQTAINFEANPNLLVLTDWNALYAEFTDTGMQTNEDFNRNGWHDFLDLLVRLQTYTANHKGVIVNLPQAITTQSGYKVNYSDLDYGMLTINGTQSRFQMGLLIDELIANLSLLTTNSIANVGLVGDDQVVPFYRVIDPSDYANLDYIGYSVERHYPEEVGGVKENPVIFDIGQAYLMSDVPYSIDTHQVISASAWLSPTLPIYAGLLRPHPNLGIGRIFSERPIDLITAIDHYESPLNLKPDAVAGAIFTGYDSNPELDIDKIATRALWGEMKSWYNNNLHYNSQAERVWSAAEFTRAIGEHYLTGIVGHSSHTAIQISGTTYIEAKDLENAAINLPSLLVGLGCHQGLSVSNYPDNVGINNHYGRALVNPLLKQGVTIFAPGSFAYILPEGLDETMTNSFLNRLLHGSSLTLGDIWQQTFDHYHTHDPILRSDNNRQQLYHTTVAYGRLFYGLPTQPIERRVAPENCLEISYQPAKFAKTIFSQFKAPLTFTIDIPNFEMEEDTNGSTLFRVPNGGDLLTPINGPSLPLVVKTLSLPENIVVFDTRLTNTNIETQPIPVQLPFPQLYTSNGDLITFTKAPSSTWPAQQFTYQISQNSSENSLTVSAIPLRYNQTESEVALYHQMTFEVDYVSLFPPEYPNINQVTINTGIDMEVNQTGLPVEIEIEHDQAETIYLVWQVKDQGGEIVDAQRFSIATIAGTTTIAFCFDTTGWQPGPKDINIYIQQGHNFTSAWNEDTVVIGIGLEEPTPQNRTYPTQTEASWLLQVREENGLLVSASGQLSGTGIFTGSLPLVKINHLQLFLDDYLLQDIPAANAEIERGTFEVTLPLGSVTEGAHIVKIKAIDSRGIHAWQEWPIYKGVPPTPTPVSTLYLPLIRKGE